VAHFGVQKFAKILKENFEKRKTVVFRKRISAKTAVFSVFKSVKRVDKKRRHLDRAPQARARIVKVSSYTRMI
jgi:hypothetical protein